MQNDWFGSSAVINFVALGIVATLVCLTVFTFQDCWFLFGHFHAMPPTSRLWYTALASVATLFGIFTFIVWRWVLPRITIALVSVSMASQVVQSFGALPSQWLRTIAFCRVCISIAVFGLYLHYKTAPRN